ncbi:MAG TPA: PAS domain-containing protein [Leptospiraceae bacterium]|nr:PAS domain-containing protein [Leptospiraceae bacterium]
MNRIIQKFGFFVTSFKPDQLTQHKGKIASMNSDKDISRVTESESSFLDNLISSYMSDYDLEKENSKRSCLCRMKEPENLPFGIDRYYCLFECAPAGYIVLDRKLRLIEFNRTVLDIFGYSRSEMLLRPVWHFIPVDFRSYFLLKCSSAAMDSAHRYADVQILGKDKERSWIRIHIFFSEPDNHYFLNIFKTDELKGKEGELLQKVFECSFCERRTPAEETLHLENEKGAV